MNKRIHLELKRTSLRPYNLAFCIITAVLLGLLYLFASIPYLDPTDPDIDMFRSYDTLIGLHSSIAMGFFIILSAVMHAKIVVEEYTGQQCILLFLYPMKRTKIFEAKLCLVTLYTTAAMVLSGILVYGIFFVTESILPISTDHVTTLVIGKSLITTFCSSLMAGLLGIVSLWIGFHKRSVSVTIVTSCILVTIISQVSVLSLRESYLKVLVLILLTMVVVIARKNLHIQVNKMEI